VTVPILIGVELRPELVKGLHLAPVALLGVLGAGSALLERLLVCAALAASRINPLLTRCLDHFSCTRREELVILPAQLELAYRSVTIIKFFSRSTACSSLRLARVWKTSSPL
jgi:hypothetical protein